MPRQKHYTVRLTEEEINAILGAAGAADAGAVAEDFAIESEGDNFLAALERATEKLKNAK